MVPGLFVDANKMVPTLARRAGTGIITHMTITQNLTRDGREFVKRSYPVDPNRLAEIARRAKEHDDNPPTIQAERINLKLEIAEGLAAMFQSAWEECGGNYYNFVKAVQPKLGVEVE